MTGNPYRYSNDRYQYFFVDIDPEKFIGLDKITFYSEFDRTDGSENPDFDL